jgi:hypothetical protein
MKKSGRWTRLAAPVLAGALIGSVFVTVARGSSSLPADKATATGSTVKVVPADAPTLLLTTKIKTSAPEDLNFSLTLECALITDVFNAGSGAAGNSSFAEAAGRLRAWITFDGNIVPVNSASSAPQPQTGSTAGNDNDKATFCYRDHQQTITDTENPQDGTDQYETYLSTKEANAFDWVWLNAGSGTHTISVWADFSNLGDTNNPPTPGSSSSGYVGNRVLQIVPTQYAVNTAV